MRPHSSEVLPKGWAWATVGDVGDDFRYGTSAKATSEDVGVPVLRMGNIFNGRLVFDDLKFLPPDHSELPLLLLQPGDLLFNRTNSAELVGKSAVFNGYTRSCTFASYLIRVRFADGCSPEFVASYLNSNSGRQWVASVATQQVGQANVNGTKLRNCTFALAPSAEQRRVIDSIDSYLTRLDDVSATLERMQRNLMRYRSSVLKTAVEGRLVSTEAALAFAEKRAYEPASELLERTLADHRRTEVASPDAPQLPELPTGWCWTNIELLAKPTASSISAGPFGTIFKAKDFRTEGVPIIFLRHVKPDKYVTEKPTFMDKNKWEELFQEYSVRGGELLITKLGDPPGDCAQYPRNIGPAMVTPDVIKMAVNEDLAVPRFVLHYLNSSVARRFVFGSAFGTTRLRLTLPLFRNMPVPLPPIAEQHRIVDKVDEHLTIIDDQEALIRAAKTRSNRLRQSILKWAFEGKLADQDPNDEPASVLLERLRSERDAAQQDKPSARKAGRPPKKS